MLGGRAGKGRAAAQAARRPCALLGDADKAPSCFPRLAAPRGRGNSCAERAPTGAEREGKSDGRLQPLGRADGKPAWRHTRAHALEPQTFMNSTPQRQQQQQQWRQQRHLAAAAAAAGSSKLGRPHLSSAVRFSERASECALQRANILTPGERATDHLLRAVTRVHQSE